MEFTYDSTTTVNRGCQAQLGDRGSFFVQNLVEAPCDHLGLKG
jgi:hypothetical protein